MQTDVTDSKTHESIKFWVDVSTKKRQAVTTAGIKAVITEMSDKNISTFNQSINFSKIAIINFS